MNCSDLLKSSTNLSDSDIEIISKFSDSLQIIADLVNEDIFIDCMCKNNKEAIVVAQANPQWAASAYTKSVVGELALQHNEPAVYVTLIDGIPVSNMKALSQENIYIKQNIIPVKNEAGKTIAALIREKDASESVKLEKKINEIIEQKTKIPHIFDKESYQEIRIREAHHRIKNNLQLLSSVTNVKVRKSTNNETRKALYENILLIQNIANMHDMLYNDAYSEYINVRSLIKRMIDNIHMFVKDRIVITLSENDLHLYWDKAVPLILAIQELVMNAIEHGFDEDSTGQIDIKIATCNEYITVSVEDNGKGIPFAPDVSDINGLGLIDALISQKLKGDVKYQKNVSGTIVTISFRNEQDNSLILT